MMAQNADDLPAWRLFIRVNDYVYPPCRICGGIWWRYLGAGRITCDACAVRRDGPPLRPCTPLRLPGRVAA